MSGRARPPTKPEYRLNRSLTLDTTDASCPNFYMSFRGLFSYASQWNRYSTSTKSDWARPRSRLEFRLNKSITLIPTIGSCSTSLIGVTMKSLLDANGVWSGLTRVPAPQVHISWSDCWIALEVSSDCFLWHRNEITTRPRRYLVRPDRRRE
jgi:hypothetical protein